MESGGIDSVSVFRGTAAGMAAAAVLLVLGSVGLYLSQAPGAALPPTAAAVAWLSVFSGGFCAARAAGRAGLWHGAAAGLTLFLVLSMLGILALDLPLRPAALLVRALAAALVGALAGMLAIAL